MCYVDILLRSFVRRKQQMRVWRLLIWEFIKVEEHNIVYLHVEYDEYDIYFFYHKNSFGYGNRIGNFESRNYK